LINVTGGEDMTLLEVSEAAQIIQEAADPDANIIFGTVIDRALQGQVKVTVIATGFLRDESRAQVRAMRHAQPHAEPAPAPARPGAGFLRGGRAVESADLTPGDDGFLPNFAGVRKDDLDIPAFLRKQMD
jgi:cell division protein FtsZ